MTSKELARIAGVSQATVSLCMNDSQLVAEATKARVKALAREHRFTLNSQARSLKTQRSNAIGMVFPLHFIDFSNNFYYNAVYNRIRKRLAASGLDLIPIYNGDHADSQSYIDGLIRGGRVDGLISFRKDLGAGVENSLSERALPCVYLLTDKSQYDGKPSVITDNAWGASLVAAYYADLGMTRVLTLGVDMATTASAVRTEAFGQTLRERGIPFSDQNVWLLPDATFESGRKIGLERAREAAAFEGVYVQGDLAALGFIEGLRTEHVRVPRDLSVIGNDNHPIGTWFHPYLSTVTSMGETEAEVICRMLTNGMSGTKSDSEKTVFRPELILRESSKQ